MNMSVSNFVKTPTNNKQHFSDDSSELRSDRKYSHKTMQQTRRLARYNKQAVQTAYNTTDNA